MKKTIIGIGNKARQGKDTLANILQEKLPNSTIVHFADALYGEVENKERKNPLIIWDKKNLFVLNEDYGNYCNYTKLPLADESVLKIVNHLRLRKSYGLDESFEYWGMNEKNSILLQWWGTEFRRKYFGEDYWITKVKEYIESSDYNYYIIPDTRFKNEHEFIKSNDITSENIYLRIERYDNKERFIARDRDPNHQSEIDLDGVDPDWNILNFNIDQLEQQVDEFIENVIK
jgi:hypothetical protein